MSQFTKQEAKQIFANKANEGLIVPVFTANDISVFFNNGLWTVGTLWISEGEDALVWECEPGTIQEDYGTATPIYVQNTLIELAIVNNQMLPHYRVITEQNSEIEQLKLKLQG